MCMGQTFYSKSFLTLLSRNVFALANVLVNVLLNETWTLNGGEQYFASMYAELCFMVVNNKPILILHHHQGY